MSANDVKGLTQIVTEEVTKIRDRARKAGENLQGQTKRAHEIVSHVEDTTEELSNSLDDLFKALGQISNMPPKDEK